MAQVSKAESEEAAARGIAAGEAGAYGPGAASVTVGDERVPLTGEGIRGARCGAKAVGRKIADDLRRRLDLA